MSVITSGLPPSRLIRMACEVPIIALMHLEHKDEYLLLEADSFQNVCGRERTMSPSESPDPRYTFH